MNTDLKGLLIEAKKDNFDELASKLVELSNKEFTIDNFKEFVETCQMICLIDLNKNIIELAGKSIEDIITHQLSIIVNSEEKIDKRMKKFGEMFTEIQCVNAELNSNIFNPYFKIKDFNDYIK